MNKRTYYASLLSNADKIMMMVAKSSKLAVSKELGMSQSAFNTAYHMIVAHTDITDGNIETLPLDRLIEETTK